ncbi:MAG: orotate phosphoribosyltransferase, partial [Candidatus Aenigmarchaeota archaeon]|nr:orotate phosphoribosyltransferase [Candidatus Aenigmarchaeota archaeon]
GEGAEVTDCLAIFTYSFQKSKEDFERKKCNLACLTDFSTLCLVAEQKQIILSDDIKSVLEWNKNPQEWGNDL